MAGRLSKPYATRNPCLNAYFGSSTAAMSDTSSDESVKRGGRVPGATRIIRGAVAACWPRLQAEKSYATKSRSGQQTARKLLGKVGSLLSGNQPRKLFEDFLRKGKHARGKRGDAREIAAELAQADPAPSVKVREIGAAFEAEPDEDARRALLGLVAKSHKWPDLKKKLGFKGLGVLLHRRVRDEGPHYERKLGGKDALDEATLGKVAAEFEAASIECPESAGVDKRRTLKEPLWHVCLRCKEKDICGAVSAWRNVPEHIRRPIRKTDLCPHCEDLHYARRRESAMLNKLGDLYKDMPGLAASKTLDDWACCPQIGIFDRIRAVLLLDDLELLETHRAHAARQSAAYKAAVAAVVGGAPRALIVLDYKESIVIGRGPRERKSAYYGRSSVSCLGFAVYKPGCSAPTYIDVLSENLAHTAEAAVCGLRLVVDKLAKEPWWGKAGAVDVWADCGPHFRALEFAHSVLVELRGKKKYTTLNFFGEHHGKSVVDGHFGVLSRKLEEASKHERLESIDELIAMISESATVIVHDVENAAERRSLDIPLVTATYCVRAGPSGIYNATFSDAPADSGSLLKGKTKKIKGKNPKRAAQPVESERTGGLAHLRQKQGHVARSGAARPAPTRPKPELGKMRPAAEALAKQAALPIPTTGTAQSRAERIAKLAGTGRVVIYLSQAAGAWTAGSIRGELSEAEMATEYKRGRTGGVAHAGVGRWLEYEDGAGPGLVAVPLADIVAAAQRSEFLFFPDSVSLPSDVNGKPRRSWWFEEEHGPRADYGKCDQCGAWRTVDTELYEVIRQPGAPFTCSMIHADEGCAARYSAAEAWYAPEVRPAARCRSRKAKACK